MYRSLSSLVPNAADLLALDLSELGRVLLVHLKSFESMHNNTVYQNGLISQKNFIDMLDARGPGQKPEYENKQSEVNKALLEAWNWLRARTNAQRPHTSPFSSVRGLRTFLPPRISAPDPIRVESNQVLVPTVVFDRQLYNQLNKMQAHRRDSYRHLIAKNSKLWESIAVSNLDAKEFHLFEDGQEMRIQSVKLEQPSFRTVQDTLGKHPEVIGSGGGIWAYPDRPPTDLISAAGSALMPARYETQFDLSPGEYTIRVVLSDGQNFGRQQAQLNVQNPDPNLHTISRYSVVATSAQTSVRPIRVVASSRELHPTAQQRR
jgi:hypothetical protein